MAYTEEQIEVIKTHILNALEEVIDPELGIDIVNLGLIYEIRFDGETGHTEIDMTLTTMGCPLADLLTDQIHDAMTDVPEVTNTEVKNGALSDRARALREGKFADAKDLHHPRIHTKRLCHGS